MFIKVLRSHEDFKGTKNMPNNLIEDVTPKFQLVKKRFNKIVVLIDSSILSKQPAFLTKLKTVMVNKFSTRLNFLSIIKIYKGC